MQSNVAENLSYDDSEANNIRRLPKTALNRVLIIEDDISLTNLLTCVLEEISPNIQIDWATSGEQAERFLKDEEAMSGYLPYDLIVADIFLEGETTGLDVWKLCQKKYPDANILVTSSMPIEQFVSCLKHEVNCPNYLPKPFSMTECKEAIDQFI